MADRIFNVLFLCTGNSARSILAEAILNKAGAGKFAAYSAGSFPKGEVHPRAISLLQRLGYSTDGLRSKSWDEFAAPGAPALDFVFTVCDNAANEQCPVWIGHPVTAHWGIPDPAAAEGDDAAKDNAFRAAFGMLERRINALIWLPVEKLDPLSLQHRLKEIGRSGGESPITIYHNPDCGTSRNVLALIRNSGAEPRIIEYLKDPPSRETLEKLIADMGIAPRALLREKGTPYAELGLSDPKLSDAMLIDAMMLHPILINRPIVITPLGTRLCRPSEAVLDILPNPQRGAFTKEDGEQVIGADGKRIHPDGTQP